MGPFNADAVQLSILTRRDGLLARAGHDLRLQASGLRLWLDEDGVHLRLDPARIEPVCARVGDRDMPLLLSHADLRRIGQNMRGEVLRVQRFPEVAFDAPLPSPGLGAVDGQLTLCGVRRPQRIYLARRGHALSATAVVTQSAYGIEPYSTMLGAIRVRDEVEIQVEVEEPAAAALIAALVST